MGPALTDSQQAALIAATQVIFATDKRMFDLAPEHQVVLRRMDAAGGAWPGIYVDLVEAERLLEVGLELAERVEVTTLRDETATYLGIVQAGDRKAAASQLAKAKQAERDEELATERRTGIPARR